MASNSPDTRPDNNTPANAKDATRRPANYSVNQALPCEAMLGLSIDKNHVALNEAVMPRDAVIGALTIDIKGLYPQDTVFQSWTNSDRLLLDGQSMSLYHSSSGEVDMGGDIGKVRFSYDATTQKVSINPLVAEGQTANWAAWQAQSLVHKLGFSSQAVLAPRDIAFDITLQDSQGQAAGALHTRWLVNVSKELNLEDVRFDYPYQNTEPNSKPYPRGTDTPYDLNGALEGKSFQQTIQTTYLKEGQSHAIVAKDAYLQHITDGEQHRGLAIDVKGAKDKDKLLFGAQKIELNLGASFDQIVLLKEFEGGPNGVQPLHIKYNKDSGQMLFMAMQPGEKWKTPDGKEQYANGFRAPRTTSKKLQQSAFERD